MLRRGTRVAKLTKKTGQVAPTGKVVDVRKHACEVRWDDGHTSIVDRGALVALKPGERR